jgi:hypothetical protein
MEKRAEKLPRLKTVEGVEECIPHAEVVGDADNEEDLLWTYEREDWSDYEY